MTADPRLERNLPAILAELGAGPAPDYVDTLLARTATTRQRPGWVFPERWLPMDTVASRAAAPSIRWRMVAIAALLIVGMIASAVLIAGQMQRNLPAPFGPAVNGRILYSWLGDVYVRATITDEPVLLIDGETQDNAVGFSLDGTRFAFLRQVGEATRNLRTDELWVARADGSDQRLVGGPFTNPHRIEWSPDGSTIAVSSETGGSPVVDLVRTDGSSSTRLDVGMAVEDATWRPPDGSQLLFRGRTSDGWKLFLADADGTGAVPLDLERPTRNWGDEDFFDAAWSPTGDRLAFATKTPIDGPDTEGTRVFVADVAPGGMVSGQRRLTTDEAVEAEFRPGWLPTGDRLVLHKWEGVKETIVVVPAVGGDIGTDLGIVSSGGLNDAIAPDGTNLLVQNHVDYMVHWIGLTDLGDEQLFSADEAASYQRVAP